MTDLRIRIGVWVGGGLLFGILVLLVCLPLPPDHDEVSACARHAIPGTRRLVVLVPGSGHGNSREWAAVRTRLEAEPALRGADWLCFDHNRRWISSGHLEDLALTLRDRIDAQWALAGGYDEITLIGHSMGGLLVRRAYLLATIGDGQTPPTLPWGSRVRRIVLFAAVSRGVDTSSTDRALGRWLLRVIPHHHMLFEDLLRGSPFIANLRIGWMRYFHTLPHPPHVVQFLGDSDQVVARSDSKDVLAFPGSGYIEIPGATHEDLYRLDGPGIDAEGRYALIRWGILAPPSARARVRVPRTQTERVVFLLHGIRALTTDEWMADLGQAIYAQDAAVGAPRRTIVRRPEYGYLTAARFAFFPWFRRHHYEAWLPDEYAEALAEALAEYPQATFMAVAHSNGTYLLGVALRQVPAMTFKRIVLAGSVLPQDFPWGDLRARKQIDELRNYRATLDWPVALLCAALRSLFMSDVGTGGFAGFFGNTAEEIGYLQGGHGAAFEGSARRQDIITYLTTGAHSDSSLTVRYAPAWFRSLSLAMLYIAWAILVSLIVSLWWAFGNIRRMLTVLAVLGSIFLILDIL